MELTRQPRALALLATSTFILAVGVAPAARADLPDAPKAADALKDAKAASTVKEPPVGAAKEAAKDAKDAKKAVDDDLMSDEGLNQPTAPTGDKPAVAKSGPTVLVLPYQPIFRSVPQNKIQTANELLAKELNQKDTIQVLRGGVGKGEAAQPTLETAAAAEKAAVKAEAEHDAVGAMAQRKKVLDELEKNAAVVEPEVYVLAHHNLARAQMWAGLDKEANETIELAARMRPGQPLEATEFSRLYRAWFQKAVAKIMADKPTDLMVRSALPGAMITLDGRAMDTAPVMLRKVVPGKHLLAARVEGVAPFGAVIDVKPGKQTDFTVTFANTLGGASVGIVADAIAENGFPRKAVEAAAAAGKEAGAAFVVAGGLAKDDQNFHVHSFVVNVVKGRIIKLDVVDFDLDLLTAEHDVLNVVQNIASTVNTFGPGESAIAVVDKRVKSQPVINEVVAAPSITSEDPKAKKGPRDVVKDKGREVFKPLKGTKVQIKDEESDQ